MCYELYYITITERNRAIWATLAITYTSRSNHKQIIEWRTTVSRTEEISTISSFKGTKRLPITHQIPCQKTQKIQRSGFKEIISNQHKKTQWPAKKLTCINNTWTSVTRSLFSASLDYELYGIWLDSVWKGEAEGFMGFERLILAIFQYLLIKDKIALFIMDFNNTKIKILRYLQTCHHRSTLTIHGWL